MGHEAGDRVLREVAGFVVRNVRGADYVFRWGGDEFLVLMSCPESQARRRGAALQAAFKGSDEAAVLPEGVGLSIGSVEVPLDTDDVLQQVKVADDRMYENKAGEPAVESLSVEQVLRPQQAPARLAGRPGRGNGCRILTAANPRQRVLRSKQTLGGFQLERRPVQFVQHRRNLEPQPDWPQRRPIGDDDEDALAFFLGVLARAGVNRTG